MTQTPSEALLDTFASRLGPKGFTRDPADMAPWLDDWRGRYHGAAAAMVSPKTTAEVSEVVRICAEAGVAIVPQGGNTGMVGGATPSDEGNAILVSLRRMDRIRSLSPESNSAVCEAGVILSNLHDAASTIGRRFPLSLGAKGSATIGGLVSTNAGGTQVLRFGTMRGLVLGVEAVLADGTIFNGLSDLKKDNRGYDLRQLLIGAEGTLGIVTAASLKLVPGIGSRSVSWIGVESPQVALKLLRFLEGSIADAVESFEIVPKSGVDLVLTHIPGTRTPLSRSHDWNVLIEVTASQGRPDISEEFGQVLGSAAESGLIEDAVVAANESQAEAFWRLRDNIAEAGRLEGPGPRLDISVPVESMPDFMQFAASAVESRYRGTRVIAFGHLGDGNIHFNIHAPGGSGPEWLADVSPAITAYVYDLVTDAGGSISAEHGIGQSKLTELERLADPARLGALRAIKRALDPKAIMNPGKLVRLAEETGAP